MMSAIAIAHRALSTLNRPGIASMTFSVHDGVCAVNVMVPKPVRTSLAQ